MDIDKIVSESKKFKDNNEKLIFNESFEYNLQKEHFDVIIDNISYLTEAFENNLETVNEDASVPQENFTNPIPNSDNKDIDINDDSDVDYAAEQQNDYEQETADQEIKQNLFYLYIKLSNQISFLMRYKGVLSKNQKMTDELNIVNELLDYLNILVNSLENYDQEKLQNLTIEIDNFINNIDKKGGKIKK